MCLAHGSHFFVFQSRFNHGLEEGVVDIPCRFRVAKIPLDNRGCIGMPALTATFVMPHNRPEKDASKCLGPFAC